MKEFCQLLGDALAKPPGDLTERLTPYILALLGGLILLIAAISFLLAPHYH